MHWVSGPADLGGRGLPTADENAYRVLESHYDVPNQGFFGIGFGMVVPTILAHGTAETKAYLNPMRSGELVRSEEAATTGPAARGGRWPG
jgi:alkylation response protein AidB-like acyl-CoA dehydrogenase